MAGLGALELIALWWARWTVAGTKASLWVAGMFAPILGAAPAGDHPGGDEAHASVWGESVWGVPSIVWHVVNFALLVGILFFATRKMVAAAQRAKRERVNKTIEDSTRLRDEMRAKFEDYDARMRDIDARMGALLTDARNEAEADRARMTESANKLAARIREDAKLVSDQEIARAKRELREEQILQSAELAEQILRSNVTGDDQGRLTTEFLEKLEARKPDNGRSA